MNLFAGISSARKSSLCRAVILLAFVGVFAVAERAGAVTLVRHAGGEFKGSRYTNSVEAINESFALGAKLLEIDLIPSREGDWVCLHDYPEVWEAGSMRARMDRALELWFAKMPRWAYPGAWIYPRATDLRSRIDVNNASTGRHHCTLPQLVEMSRQHPGVSFISDTKYDNFKLLDTLIRQPEGSFVPQVYNLAEYKYARALGFKRLIFTLYKHGDYSQLGGVLDDPQLWKIVMPAEWLCSGSKNPPPAWLNKFHGEILVHTINDPGAVCKSPVRVDGYYSDALH